MMERMMTAWEKIEKWVLLVLTAGTLGLVTLALHDMQTAEGVGLYFALLGNTTNRMPYDILTDVVGMAGFLVLLLLPWRCIGDGSAGALFRLLAGLLAFLPVVSIAHVLHIVDGGAPVVPAEAIVQGRIAEGVLAGLAQVMVCLRVLLPLVLLLWAAVATEGGLKRTLKYKIMTVVCAWLVLVGIVLPQLQAECGFVIVYLLVLVCFEIWELLWKRYPALRRWGMLLFGLLWLRGVFCLMELMSVYAL